MIKKTTRTKYSKNKADIANHQFAASLNPERALRPNCRARSKSALRWMRLRGKYGDRRCRGEKKIKFTCYTGCCSKSGICFGTWTNELFSRLLPTTGSWWGKFQKSNFFIMISKCVKLGRTADATNRRRSRKYVICFCRCGRTKNLPSWSSWRDTQEPWTGWSILRY